MASKTTFLFVLVSCGFLSVEAEDCVPKSVSELQIYSNATLTWTVHPDESCEITHFQIDVTGSKEDEYHFKVNDNQVDVSFLEICEEWSFTVTPISHEVVGFSKTVTDYIPLPPDADLTLSYFNATSLGARDVLLEWDLMNHTHGDCSLRYRLSVEDEELGIAQDVYVQGNSLHLTFLSPCVPYQLGVRAVNMAHPNIEGPLVMTEMEIPAKAQVVPQLQIVDIQATTISTTWTPEGGNNRCPLKALYIDAGNYFNISIPLPQNPLNLDPVPIELKSLRPDSMYYLRVYVENSGGVSTASQIGIQTLELSPS